MQLAEEQSSRDAQRPVARSYLTSQEGEKSNIKNIQSVDRALSILEALSSSNSALMLNEIAKQVGINLSTCHHLVSTLVHRGYVVYGGRSRGYSLSSKLEAVSQRSVREFDLIEFVRPSLQELNASLREATQMAVLRGSALVTRLRFASHVEPQTDVYDLPKLHAAHALATGKAILAWLPETELARVVADNGLPSFNDRTITSLGQLTEELRLVRRSGIAADDGEFRADTVGFAATVRDMSGAVVCSIGVSIPKKRATDSYRDYLVRAVRDCARDLSGRMPAGCFA